MCATSKAQTVHFKRPRCATTVLLGCVARGEHPAFLNSCALSRRLWSPSARGRQALEKGQVGPSRPQNRALNGPSVAAWGVHHTEFRSAVEPCWEYHVHFVTVLRIRSFSQVAARWGFISDHHTAAVRGYGALVRLPDLQLPGLRDCAAGMFAAARLPPQVCHILRHTGRAYAGD